MFIPLVNTGSGELVPNYVWLALGHDQIAYQLKPLLFKPGLDVLCHVSSLADYVGWPGKLLLDVRNLWSDENETLRIRSPFDGRMVQLHRNEYQVLLSTLQPDELIEENNERLSDVPMTMSREGLFMEDRRWSDVKVSSIQSNFEKLQLGCVCPTCSMGLTKAYLHHLWFHVPTLCQRYLLQHNAFNFNLPGSILPI